MAKNKPKAPQFDSNGEIEIDYTPRTWAATIHDHQAKYKVLVVHRGAGKTHFCINQIIREAATQTKGDAVYAYIAPQFNQVKRNTWEPIKRYLDPLGTIVEFNETELKAKFENGSILYCLGADNIEALRGLHLDGLVIDEMADMPQSTWGVLYPMTRVRKAWTIFIGTPKGHNIFYEFYLKSIDPANAGRWAGWHLDATKTGVFSKAELEEIRADFEGDFEQEYMCSFEASGTGAYYSKQIANIILENRLQDLPIDPYAPVHTAWDLGLRDSTAIWFWQEVPERIHFIDFAQYENESLESIIYYVKQKGYRFGKHYAPHDIMQREFTTNVTRLDTASKLGIDFNVTPKLAIMDGINAVRQLLPKCRFNLKLVGDGWECLKNYAAEYDPHKGIQKNRPKHDHYSHGADAFRYAAINIGNGLNTSKPNVTYLENNPTAFFNERSTWDPFGASF